MGMADNWLSVCSVGGKMLWMKKDAVVLMHGVHYPYLLVTCQLCAIMSM